MIPQCFYCHDCLRVAHFHMTKDLLMAQQLSHPNLLRLLGWCVRGEETVSTLLQEHGMAAILEYSQPLDRHLINSWTLGTRLQHTLEILDLLDYLDKSPVGSLMAPHLKLSNFQLVEGHIKLTDMEYFKVATLKCTRHCPYGLQCMHGVCDGYSNRRNMMQFKKVFGEIFFTKMDIGNVPEVQHIWLDANKIYIIK